MQQGHTLFPLDPAHLLHLPTSIKQDLQPYSDAAALFHLASCFTEDVILTKLHRISKAALISGRLSIFNSRLTIVCSHYMQFANVNLQFENVIQ